MRKVLVFIFSITLVLFLTGCGAKKTLECKIDMSNQLLGLGKMDSTISADFEGKSMQKMNLKMNIEITSSTIQESGMARFKSIFDNVCKNGQGGIKFPECNVTQNGKKVTLDASVSKSEIDDKSSTYGSVEKTKEELEKQGYTCTIK